MFIKFCEILDSQIASAIKSQVKIVGEINYCLYIICNKVVDNQNYSFYDSLWIRALDCWNNK